MDLPIKIGIATEIQKDISTYRAHSSITMTAWQNQSNNCSETIA